MCYACLPMVFDLLHQLDYPYSVILVISPLNALISDQVTILQNKRLRATKLSECTDDMEA